MSKSVIRGWSSAHWSSSGKQLGAKAASAKAARIKARSPHARSLHYKLAMGLASKSEVKGLLKQSRVRSLGAKTLHSPKLLTKGGAIKGSRWKRDSRGRFA